MYIHKKRQVVTKLIVMIARIDSSTTLILPEMKHHKNHGLAKDVYIGTRGW